MVLSDVTDRSEYLNQSYMDKSCVGNFVAVCDQPAVGSRSVGSRLTVAVKHCFLDRDSDTLQPEVA